MGGVSLPLQIYFLHEIFELNSCILHIYYMNYHSVNLYLQKWVNLECIPVIYSDHLFADTKMNNNNLEDCFQFAL
jgi:hypothetical protein